MNQIYNLIYDCLFALYPVMMFCLPIRLETWGFGLKGLTDLCGASLDSRLRGVCLTRQDFRNSNQ
jgi:hypothetical protein